MRSALYEIPEWSETWKGLVHVQMQGTFIGVKGRRYLFEDDNCISRVHANSLEMDTIMDLEKGALCKIVVKGRLQKISKRGAVLLATGSGAASGLSSRHVTGIEQYELPTYDDDEEDWEDWDDEDE